MTLADRLAAGWAGRLRSFGSRAPGRFAVEVAGLLVVSLGIDEPWGTQVAALHGPPDPAAVDAAVAWCRQRGRSPVVVVREQHRASLAHLDEAERMPALVAPAVAQEPGEHVEEGLLRVRPAHDPAEFLAVYRPAFGLRPEVAAALVVDADLDDPQIDHLVGVVGDEVVACAQVRFGENGEPAYISGVGVRPDRQRHAFGGQMLSACREVAAARGCDSVWLNASPTSRAFYELIGFELVDTHVALATS